MRTVEPRSHDAALVHGKRVDQLHVLVRREIRVFDGCCAPPISAAYLLAAFTCGNLTPCLPRRSSSSTWLPASAAHPPAQAKAAVCSRFARALILDSNLTPVRSTDCTQHTESDCESLHSFSEREALAVVSTDLEGGECSLYCAILQF